MHTTCGVWILARSLVELLDLACHVLEYQPVSLEVELGGPVAPIKEATSRATASPILEIGAE